MRVISGQYKGYPLVSPKGNLLRPTSDRVKEALFNILSGFIRDAFFLDLFAGTGNVGIEAISRGAKQACFVESNPRHVKILQKNLEKCGIKNKAAVIQGDVFSYLKGSDRNNESFRVVFLDPPYSDPSLDLILEQPEWRYLLQEDGFLIVEHFHKISLDPKYQTIQKSKEYRYGDSVLTFFEHCP